MKTADLQGAELDKLVARIEGVDDSTPLRSMAVTLGSIDRYSPSTNWQQGGEIIEREKIGLDPAPVCDPSDLAWAAEIYLESEAPMGKVVLAYGPTPLIAAMRAYCASKFGEEVDE